MSEREYNVLFICTGNSARSIMAEALLNSLGQGRFKAFSAGSNPAGTVNAMALDLIRRNRLSAENLRSKPWDEFAVPDAPELDFVFTVCDKAAGETCPVWPGQQMTAHWGVEDPSATQGSEDQVAKAFSDVFRILHRRISLLTCLPIDRLDSLALKRNVDDIGKVRN